MSVKRPVFVIMWNALFLVAVILMPSPLTAKSIMLAFSPGKGAAVASIDDMPGWLGLTVEIRDVIDNRENVRVPAAPAAPGNGDVLGISLQENREPYTTHDNVPFWVTRSIMYVFHANGVSLARDNASIIIEPTLKKLFVTEGNTYRGKACIEFTVSDNLGTKLWSEEVVDSSNYWGSTLSEEDFLNALGNAVVNTVGNLLLDHGLNEILLKQPRSPGKAFHPAIHRPEDLGIRGKFRSAPRGMTIASAALLVGATVVLAATQSTGNSDDRSLGVLSIPLYVVGSVLGTMAGIKWSLWYNWYYLKPSPVSSLVRPQFSVVIDLP